MPTVEIRSAPSGPRVEVLTPPDANPPDPNKYLSETGDYTVPAGGGGAVDSVQGSDGLTPTSPQTGPVTLSGLALLARDGSNGAAEAPIVWDDEGGGTPQFSLGFVNAGGFIQISSIVPGHRFQLTNVGSVEAIRNGGTGQILFQGFENLQMSGTGPGTVAQLNSWEDLQMIGVGPASTLNASGRGTHNFTGTGTGQFLAGGHTDFSAVGAAGGALSLHGYDSARVGATGNLELDSNGQTYQWPGADGTAGQALVTDGAGALSFATVGGSTSPAGANREIQFNDSGSFGASSLFSFIEAADNRQLNVTAAAAAAEARVYCFADDGNSLQLSYTDAGVGAGEIRATNGNLVVVSQNRELLLSGDTALKLENGATQWEWPGADGTAGQALVTDGAGNLSFATVGGGGGSVAQYTAPRTPLAGIGLSTQAHLHKLVAERSFTCTHIGMLTTNVSAGDDYYLALYDTANNRIAVTGAINPPTNGWARYALLASVALTAGTEYWVAVKGSTGAVNIGVINNVFNDIDNQRQVNGLGGNGNPPPDPIGVGVNTSIVPCLYLFGTL